METYCILMSLYAKDCPAFFRQAFSSVLTQTRKPAQFVLVEDGPLTAELTCAVNELKEACLKAEIPLNIVSLKENRGLGPALNEGLKVCRKELVARMDADDISLPDRCERQLSFLEVHPEVAALSGKLAEFEGDAPDPGKIPPELTRKAVPETDREIRNCAASRNPVNHPCVMYRKSAVLAAGGYRSMPFFEDYDLWLRMLSLSDGKENGKFANLPEVLLLMRADGMFERRGGLSYARCMLTFRNSMYRAGYLSLPKHLFTAAARAFVSLLPAGLRRWIYRKFLR